MSDTYLLDVEYVDDDYDEQPKRTRVCVVADTNNDAELAALEMVAADGRKPTRVLIDWDNF